MTRAYLRLDPGFFERKAIDQNYPLPAVAALVGVLCLADSQPQRGSFRDEKLLKVLLGPGARWVTLLIEKGDLVRDGQRLHVDGWEIWQEGDLTVHDRMARFRNKRNGPRRNDPNGGERNGSSSHAGDARGHSAEALAGQSGSVQPLPNERPANFMGWRPKPKPGEHLGQHPNCAVCEAMPTAETA